MGILSDMQICQQKSLVKALYAGICIQAYLQLIPHAGYINMHLGRGLQYKVSA